MTVVGKLLVFLNLVFSLVVGTFAALSFGAGAHTRANEEKMKAEMAVTKGTLVAYEVEAKRLSTEKAELNKKLIASAGRILGGDDTKDPALSKELKSPESTAKFADRMMDLLEARRQDITKLQQEAEALEKKWQAERNNSKGNETVAKISVVDVQRMREDVRITGEQLKEERKKVTDLIGEKNSMRDQKVAAEIVAADYKARNERLAMQVEELGQANRKLKLAAGPGALARKLPGTDAGTAPADDLEGSISKVGEGKLVKITIGSDNGLALDNTLEVFRLGASPKYLGRIRIVSITPNEAVGQAVGKMYGAMKEGDTVASRIMGNR